MTTLTYPIPTGAKLSRCLGCDTLIYWIKTVRGKPMPLNVDGTPHWGTCPEANRFRSKEDSSQQVFEFE